RFVFCGGGSATRSPCCTRLLAKTNPMPDGASNIRIVIADDHPIMRDGLKRVLESEPGLQVVGEAASGEEAVELARQLRPDILLLDVSMPKLNGLQVLERIGPGDGSLKSLILTVAI